MAYVSIALASREIEFSQCVREALQQIFLRHTRLHHLDHLNQRTSLSRPLVRELSDGRMAQNLALDAVREDRSTHGDPDALACCTEEGEQADAVRLVFVRYGGLHGEGEGWVEHAESDAVDQVDDDPHWYGSVDVEDGLLV